MTIIDPRAAHVIQHPWDFAWRTLRAFRANQGLLLAGAVAYYALRDGRTMTSESKGSG